jgi:Putative auto-transporter adhesin, head GIN domain
MTRVLVMTVAVGLALAVFCFATAGALGGFAWGPNGLNWKLGDHWGRHLIHVDLGDGERATGPTTTRDFAWSGGDSLELNAPADLEYTQGPTTRVTVTGPKSLLDKLTIHDGHIDLDDSCVGVCLNGDGPIKIVMTAPNITKFEANGSQSISILGYDHDQLKVQVSGSGDVVAKGKANHASLDIAGSGNADLGGLTGDDAKVAISGSGDATIAPKQQADIQVSGSGDVHLMTHPPVVHSQISGSGDVTQPGEKTKSSDDD